MDTVDALAHVPINLIKQQIEDPTGAKRIEEAFNSWYEASSVIYKNSDEGLLGSVVLGGMKVLADAVGVTDLNEAWTGKELYTNRELSDKEIVSKYEMAGIKLTATAATIYEGAGLAADMMGGRVAAAGETATGRLASQEAKVVEGAGVEAEAAGKSSSIIKANCFPAGTLVATANGFKPIEEVSSGDLIWSFDFRSGVWVLCKVAVLHTDAYDGHYVTLFFDNGTSLEVTEDHPFWVLEGEGLAERPQLKYRDAYEDSDLSLPGRWVHSQALRVGDQLYGRTGVQLRIREVRPRMDCLQVYNLSVLGLPYYAVGPLGILVHNSETRGVPGGAKTPGTTKQGELFPEDVPQSTGAKRGPKTDPNEPHNAKIREEADKLEAEGNKIVAGGGRDKERLIDTPGGKKSGRRPDILYETPEGELRGRNVGRTTADGTPVPREGDALDDLNGPGKLPTDFVPYDR